MGKALRVLLWLAPVVVVLIALRWSPALRTLAGVPAAHPVQVNHRLPNDAVVIDVRSPAEFRRDSIPGALSVPLPALDAALARGTLPRQAHLIMVCEHGFRSVVAASKAFAQGFHSVASLEGGMAAWRAHGLPVTSNAEPGDAIAPAPQVPTTKLDQAVSVFVAFLVKPFYMLLALVLALWLWRQRERDLVLIRGAMLTFFAGELSCALAMTVTGAGDLFEVGHQAGMVLFGMFLPWGVLELIDARVLSYSHDDRACSLQRLCQRCWKREAVPCGLQRLMRFALPCLAVVALVPLSAPVRTMNIQYDVFGTVVPYTIGIFEALLVTRVFPICAAWLFVVAFVTMGSRRDGMARAKAPFFLAVGFLAFSLLRFLLLHTFWTRPFWSDAWEEMTELFTVCTVAWFLWNFRRQLALPAFKS
jgi:rhodanese-related sulfurtransferase